MSPPDPPIAEWSDDGALRAIEALARDLPYVDADTAAARLARLTAEQRALVDRAIDAALDLARDSGPGDSGTSENGSPPAPS